MRIAVATILLCMPVTAAEDVYVPVPLTDQALTQIEEAFGDPPPVGWEARLAAWEKTPEGKKEMKMWRKQAQGGSHE